VKQEIALVCIITAAIVLAGCTQVNTGGLGTPSGSVTCFSSDPPKFQVKSESFAKDSGKLVVSNGRGEIRITSVSTKGGPFSTATIKINGSQTGQGEIKSPEGQDITIDIAGSNFTNAKDFTGTIEINYLDMFSYEKKLSLMCSGTN
jgi:hypothetical protein